MHKRLIVLAGCIGFSVFGAHHYELVPVEGPPGSTLTAAALNNSGQVVGSVSFPGEDISRAFIWENGVITDLASAGENSSHAHDINNSGQVVGWINSPAGTRAVRFEHDGVLEISEGLRSSHALAINDLGQIVGAGRPSFTSGASFRSQPFQFAPEQKNLEGSALFIDPPEHNAVRVNNSGQVLINSSGYPYRTQPSVRLLNQGQDFLDSIVLWEGGQGIALNDLGHAAGQGDLEFLADQALLWRDGTLLHLPAPKGRSAVASALNNQGQAAGHILNTFIPVGGPQPWDALLWENGIGYSLRDLILQPIGALDHASITVVDINDSGAILINLQQSTFDLSGPAQTTTAAYVLKPVEQAPLPTAFLTLPHDESLFAQGDPVQIEWETSGAISDLAVVAFPARKPASELPPVHGESFTVAALGNSLVLTNLPPGPVAIMLQGRDPNGVRFVSPPRYLRIIGPARLVPLGKTSNGWFEIALDSSPEIQYRLEWTTNFTDWHVIPVSYGSTFHVPFFPQGNAFTRAVRISNGEFTP